MNDDNPVTDSAPVIRFASIAASGDISQVDRAVPAEMPVAIEFNGIGYAVLMTTPDDIVDLAYGFALSERLIDGPGDLLGVETHRTGQGIVMRVAIAARLAERLLARVRHRVGESACGMCGIENLDQALRPLPRIGAQTRASDAAAFAALSALRATQPLNRATGAVHAAAACTSTGAIRLTREDVGRHNALDKVIGAMLRQGMDWDGGFALLSSRCSYELVEKAALADCPMLVTISAPTTLAVRRAAEAGLALRVLARPDAMLAPA